MLPWLKINLLMRSPEIPVSRPDMVAWVLNWNYQNYTGRGQYFKKTFGIGLMAMRAAAWRKITGYQGSIEALLRHYR